MTIQQVLTVLLGPAGIVLGWWLHQHTLRGNAERQAKQTAEAEERQRVLDTVRLGRDTAALVRSLLHAMYLKSRNGEPPKGLDEIMNEFNCVRDDFRGTVLALRVLGPSWAVEDAERLNVETTKLAELAFIMQEGVKAEHMTSVNADLPELDRLLNEYVSTVSNRYNRAAFQLPPHPDMDADARWKASGEALAPEAGRRSDPA